MQFYVIPNDERELPVDAKFPCVSLFDDNWDDYTYKTTFYMTYYSSPSDFTNIGEVKILDIGLRPEGPKRTELELSFQQLDDKYCSLGQSYDYYKDLAALGQDIGNEILSGLNDVVYDRERYESFRKHDAFTTSLIRGAEARKIAAEGVAYEATKSFKFTFKTKLEDADAPHILNFSFVSYEDIPHRIQVLIGNNGVGKTQVLSRLANSLSGWEVADGEFEPDKPLFSKIFTVSYSPFDDFKRPLPEDENRLSYRYCGIRDVDGNINIDNLKQRWENSVGKIKADQDKDQTWKETLEKLFLDSHISDTVYEKPIESYDRLSSGQRIITFILADIIGNIEKNSLLLIDEPENHLHPTLLARFVYSLRVILENYLSFSIISTHSPIILQETPSKCVQVIYRDGFHPRVTGLTVESFGENLTAITEDVFNVSSVPTNWTEVLREMSKSYDYKSIMDMFDDELSYNARVFLKTIEDELGI